MRSGVQQLNVGVLWSQSCFIFLCFEYLVSAFLMFLSLALYICIVIDTKTGAVNLSVVVYIYPNFHIAVNAYKIVN